MSETLKNRVSRVIAASAHSWLDKLESLAPAAVLQQYTRELDEVINEVRVALGKVAGNRHLVQKQYASLNQEHDQLGTSMESIVAQNREDLLKTAIGRQLDIEAQLPILENNLAELAQEEKELSHYVDALLGKQREMRDAIAAFEQSQAAAQTDTQTQAPRSAVNKAQSITAAFDDAYQRQTGQSVLQQQATTAQTANLKELHNLARENSIALRLAQIKASNKSATD